MSNKTTITTTTATITTITMADREDKVYKAKLAEQAERYDGELCEICRVRAQPPRLARCSDLTDLPGDSYLKLRPVNTLRYHPLPPSLPPSLGYQH